MSHSHTPLMFGGVTVLILALLAVTSSFSEQVAAEPPEETKKLDDRLLKLEERLSQAEKRLEEAVRVAKEPSKVVLSELVLSDLRQLLELKRNKDAEVQRKKTETHLAIAKSIRAIGSGRLIITLNSTGPESTIEGSFSSAVEIDGETILNINNPTKGDALVKWSSVASIKKAPKN